MEVKVASIMLEPTVACEASQVTGVTPMSCGADQC